jgi:hypothetical protein
MEKIIYTLFTAMSNPSVLILFMFLLVSLTFVKNNLESRLEGVRGGG